MTVYKRLQATKQQPEDLGNRVIRFRASTSDVDRSGDVIVQGGWDLASFETNPVFLAMHDKEKLPVGRVINHELDDSGLMVDVEFMDPKDFDDPSEEVKFADTVYQMYKRGFLNAVSVGFIPREVEPIEETGGRRFIEQELYEISAVTVPDNPEALAVLRELNQEDRDLLHKWAEEAFTWSKAILETKEQDMEDGDSSKAIDEDKVEELLDLINEAMSQLQAALEDDEPDTEDEPEEDGSDEMQPNDKADNDEQEEAQDEEQTLTLEEGSNVLVEGQPGVIVEINDEEQDQIAVIRLSDGSDEDNTVEAPVRNLIPVEAEQDDEPVEDEQDEMDEPEEQEQDQEPKASKPFDGPDDEALADVPGVMELDEDQRALWVQTFNDVIDEDESNEAEAIRAAWAAVNQEEARQKYLESKLYELDIDDLRPSEPSMYEIDFE